MLQALARAAPALRRAPARALATAPPAVAAAIRAAQAVAFDVDSTVITTEGIDELATYLGKGAAVAALTRAAMGGAVPFRDALAARLALLAPSRGAVDAFVAAHAPALTPGLAALVAALQARGTAVYLVSGGFTQMILPVADALRVPRARVHANTLLFDAATGAFAGFDEAAPTSRDGGKAAVLRALKAAHGYAPLIMVGDGATDLQARPPADAFVGYGGVVEREVVRKGADWFVKDWAEFTALVEEGARA
jgi:phosphoserine phosphatase